MCRYRKSKCDKECVCLKCAYIMCDGHGRDSCKDNYCSDYGSFKKRDDLTEKEWMNEWMNAWFYRGGGWIVRVRFGKRIYLCTVITHPEDSKLLIITTPNGVHTVNMITCEQAEFAYNQLLVNGCYDVSEYEYSN